MFSGRRGVEQKLQGIDGFLGSRQLRPLLIQR
jgi:hypothetical protein